MDGRDAPLRRADVVIVDADTAEMLTGTLPSGEQSGLRVSGELERRIHTRYTVLMLSDTKGIFLSDNKYHEMLLPFDVSEVDRSGADDSFISALTYDYATRIKAGGRDIGHAKNYGEGVASVIDSEGKRIIDECYAKAKAMIEEHIDVLHKCSDLLIQKEKIGQEEFEQLFE